MSRTLREIAAPFVATVPAGARVRTRLRVSARDAEVLAAAGRHLGSLAGRDLAARCAEGWLDARGRAVSRAARKRALTVESSSRWAGAITRASEDAYQLGSRNLQAERRTLQARARKIGARLAAPAGGKQGLLAGYASPAERHAKTIRLKALQARLARVERRIAGGSVPVTRGGRTLMRARQNLAAAGLTQAQWRERWDAARLFLSADGERDAPWGNYTITWNPDEGWLDVNLPTPLAYLANRPHGRYRLSCEVRFAYRGDEVAAQAATGAVRYDICLDPAKGRWYVDASWTAPARPVPSVQELRAAPVVAVDLNAGHLAVAGLAPDGNVTGTPLTIPLSLVGLPAATRDGRVRDAVSWLIATAREHGARAVVIEDLNFARARELGREETGNRPARGKKGRGFRRLLAGIPTARFRDRLVQMSANAGLSVIVVDPAYTSRWGAEHWLASLREHHPMTTGHHAAALVIGRRGQGHRARRRANGNRAAPEDAPRPARARPRKHPTATAAPRKPAAPRGTRQPPGGKTGTPHRTTAGNQAPEDRSRAPTEPIAPLSVGAKERCWRHCVTGRELLADGAGAVGYLLKDRVLDGAQFTDAVTRVARGGTAMDPEVIARLLRRGSAVEGPAGKLSPRELEVLALMAEGRSNAAIAGRLFVTERAVAKHTASIFAKLDLQPSDDDNRRVLAVLAYLGR